MDRNVSNKKPLVCLVDSRDDGHHPTYAAVYAQVLRELGCDVWLAAPARMIAAMPQAEVRGDAAGSLTMKPWEPPDRSATGATRPEVHGSRLWETLGSALDQASRSAGRYPDFMLHMYLDDFVTEMLPRRAVEDRIRCPFAGLWFKPPLRRPPTWREAAKRLVRFGRRYPLLRSRQCAGILLLDASDSQHLSRGGLPRIVEVPEVSNDVLPTAEPDIVADIRRRAAGRSIFSVVGSLEGRKGLGPFLQALDVAPTNEWFFVMAGKIQRNMMDSETSRLLDTLITGRDPRVFLVDRWLDDEVLNAIVACSNLVHVYYFDWIYSSNMICKGAAYDVPVIGGIAGYIGRMIRTYDLGFTVKAPPELAARFIPGFAADVAAFQKSVAFRDGCRRYRAANNPAVLGNALCQLLQGCLPASRFSPDGEAGSLHRPSIEMPLHAN
jgi:hypothetical protein